MKTTPLALAATTLLACGGFDGTAARPEGTRLITGRLVPPAPSELAQQTLALRLVAAEIDGREASPIRALHASPAFDPTREASFRLAVPKDRAVSLLFVVPHAGTAGRFVAGVRFPKNGAGDLDDLLLGGAADLDLGLVKIRGRGTSSSQASLGGNLALLGEGDAKNPLAQNDADGDGTPDVDDADDDNDLYPDDLDADANGDGIEDAHQRFSALAPFDLDGTAIPDMFEP